MDTYQTPAIAARESSSRLERFLASERPGFLIVTLAFGTLVAVTGLLWSYEPWHNALQSLYKTSPNFLRVYLIALIVAWPLSTVATHLIARRSRSKASFWTALHITGKAWVLHLIALLVIDAVLVLLTSLAGIGLAEFWYAGTRGGIIWLIYPATIRSIYGQNTRSCLIALVTWGLMLLLLFFAASIIGQIVNRIG